MLAAFGAIAAAAVHNKIVLLKNRIIALLFFLAFARDML